MLININNILTTLGCVTPFTILNYIRLFYDRLYRGATTRRDYHESPGFCILNPDES